MAKGVNQKKKLVYLQELFLRRTDEEHGVTIAQMAAYLAARDVSADRKTLYQDIEELRDCGLDIVTRQEGRQHLYYLASREFELPELKLLVDSVQSAKFITERKSQQLIAKLATLCSENEARQLRRQVLISGRIKTMNESIYYNVDALHAAISQDRRVRFQYFRWNARKEMEKRHGGKWYTVSPWHLVWDDEYYYLVAFDSESAQVRHYRVDKMLGIRVVPERRDGHRALRDVDLAAYSRRLFGMFGGESTMVTILAREDLAGIFIDRFGKDITMLPQDDGMVLVRVEVVPSDQFLGWLAALGPAARITAPAAVAAQMKALLQSTLEQYE